MTVGPIAAAATAVPPEVATPAAPAVDPPPGPTTGGGADASPTGTTTGSTPATKPDPLTSLGLNNSQDGVTQPLRLRIEYDQAAGDFVYYGVDPQTGQVVNQYPPKEVLARAAYLRQVAGLVVDQSS